MNAEIRALNLGISNGDPDWESGNSGIRNYLIRAPGQNTGRQNTNGQNTDGKNALEHKSGIDGQFQFFGPKSRRLFFRRYFVLDPLEPNKH